MGLAGYGEVGNADALQVLYDLNQASGPDAADAAQESGLLAFATLSSTRAGVHAGVTREALFQCLARSARQLSLPVPRDVGAQH